jgi:hypothetical protein
MVYPDFDRAPTGRWCRQTCGIDHSTPGNRGEAVVVGGDAPGVLDPELSKVRVVDDAGCGADP